MYIPYKLTQFGPLSESQITKEFRNKLTDYGKHRIQIDSSQLKQEVVSIRMKIEAKTCSQIRQFKLTIEPQ